LNPDIFQRAQPSSHAHPERVLTWLCYGAMISLSIGLNLLPVFLTTLANTFGGAAGLDHEQLGRLGALSFGGLAVGIILTGPLADRWGAKPFVQLGNGFICASLMGAAFAPNYGILGLSLFFVGLGGGILDMVLSPVVAALNPSKRTAALNMLHSFYCVGAVVTILVGTLCLRAGFGWRTACLSLAPLPAGLLIAFASRKFPPLANGGQRTGVRELLLHRWFIVALVAIFLGGATELGLAQWLPAYAETDLGYSAWVGGSALLAFSIAMTAGRMLIGAGRLKLGTFQVMTWSCGLSVILFLLGSFLPVPSLALAACIAAGFTGSCLWPTMLAVTADRYPQGGATMFGLLAAFGNAGGIVMPWIVGWVADRHSLHWGIAVSAVAPAIMLILVAALRGDGKTR
jgi:MFS family permease